MVKCEKFKPLGGFACLAAVALAFGLVFAACGGDEDDGGSIVSAPEALVGYWGIGDRGSDCYLSIEQSEEEFSMSASVSFYGFWKDRQSVGGSITSVDEASKVIHFSGKYKGVDSYDGKYITLSDLGDCSFTYSLSDDGNTLTVTNTSFSSDVVNSSSCNSTYTK